MSPVFGAAVAGAAGAIAKKAAEDIINLVELIRNEKLTENDSEYYRKWLEVAMLAIQGLEGEYEGILHQAQGCDFNNPEQKRVLADRIDGYVNGELLRPKFKEALGHLERGKEVLKTHADRLLLLPKTRRRRKNALDEYAEHVDQLQGYFGSLGNYQGESAVALEDLRLLRLVLSLPSAEVSRDFVKMLQRYRDKSMLFDSTESAANVIDALRAAFR